jgi:hypothetical protein
MAGELWLEFGARANMFDSTAGLYEGLFRRGAARARVADDRDWMLGRAVIPPGESPRWDVHDLVNASGHLHLPHVGQLALSNGSALPKLMRGFGERLLSRYQPLAPLVGFHENFRRQWFSGATAEGPVARILLDAFADAGDGVLLIYDVTSWVLVNTRAAAPKWSEVRLVRKPVPQGRLPKRVTLRCRLPRPGSWTLAN